MRIFVRGGEGLYGARDFEQPGKVQSQGFTFTVLIEMQNLYFFFFGKYRAMRRIFGFILLLYLARRFLVDDARLVSTAESLGEELEVKLD